MNWLDQFKNRKRVVYGTGSIAAVLLVVGILVVLALLANWHQWRGDVTQGKTQSLSPLSRNLVLSVDKPLTMTAFVPEGLGERSDIKDMLQRYAYVNPKISFQLVDPEREPLKAKEAGYRFSGSVLLEYNGRRLMADRADENSITNALRRLLKPKPKKVYFLTGHGEADIASPEKNGLQIAKQALDNEGYEIASLSLVAQPQVPQDAAAIIVAAPQKPLLSSEVDALKAYLGRGGRLLVMLEPFQDGGLKGLLADYGITLDDGLILDVNQISQSLRISAVMPIALNYGPTRITRDFKNTITMFPMSRPLTWTQGVKGVGLMPIVSSTPTSYEKLGKDWLKAGKGDFDAKTDKKGPFTIGVLAEIDLEAGKPASAAPQPGEHKAYLAVYGDLNFANNSYFAFSGNGDLFLNTVNYLAQEEQQITVREARPAQFLLLSGNRLLVMFLLCLVFGPLVLLVAGIRAYRVRRSRK